MMANVVEFPGASQAVSVITEDAVAELVAREHGEDIRFCPEMGKWLRWSGLRWELDETGQVFELARDVCRVVTVQTGKDKWGSHRTVQSVTNFLKTRQDLVVRAPQLDANPWHLGTPSGYVDLKTGHWLHADRNALITKATLIDPAPEGAVPKAWLAFLSQATNKDPKLVRFLKRLAGYALTGLISQHALWFVYGPGGNGKSTFINAIRDIMGSYAKHAPSDTFMDTESRHPTELAMLQGARLVTASETEEGKAWAQSKINALTGGDPVTARFMNKDFFEYKPTFKLVVVGNHRPVLQSVDDAARRRFRMVPFKVKPTNPDADLGDRLKAEYPAILRWMIDGCLDWDAEEMDLPEVVRSETFDYFNDQDAVGQWLKETLKSEGHDLPREHQPRLPSARLFASWVSWAKEQGEPPGSQKTFSEQLVKRGFIKHRGTAGVFFYCVRMLTDKERDDADKAEEASRGR